jgi:oxygen-independent coproporphyrinogen-3 oxidase
MPFKLPPLSLYIHFPWCVRKCPYCDFNSHALRGDLPEAAYLEALVADLDYALPQVQGRPLISIFLGGGTPSLFSATGLAHLLTAIRTRMPLAPEAEITLEANPGALTETRASGNETRAAEQFAGFRAAGINRISLGIQSFDPAHLLALGRIHGRDDALNAATQALRHFERCNLDLMYGLPGQTLEAAQADLETALRLGPSHLSCYQLTVEPNTRFAALPPKLPDPDVCADMEEALTARLATAGFAHYEISAFARPDHACRHNLNYWQFGDYLGIGAGAHGKLTLPEGKVLRQMRWKRPETYLERAASGQPVQEAQEVPARQLPFEFLMNALRLTAGFEAGLFEARTGLPLAVILPRLREAAKEGWLFHTPERITPTGKGQRFLNRLLLRFLDEELDER